MTAQQNDRGPEDAEFGYGLEKSADLDPIVEAICPKCGGTKQTAQGICLRCAEPASRDEFVVLEPDVDPTDGNVHIGDEGDDIDAEKPLSVARSTDGWVPWALAGAAAIVLIAGMLVGAPGLFPLHTDAESQVPWWSRLGAVVRLPVFAAAWTFCAVAALATIAWLEDRPVGSWEVAAKRLFAAIMVARLATFIELPFRGLTFTLEVLAQLVIFGALTIALFRLRIGVALRLLLVTVLYGVGATVFAQFIAWALRVW